MTSGSRRIGSWPRLAATAIDYGAMAAVSAAAGLALGRWWVAGADAGPEGRDALQAVPDLVALAGAISVFAVVGVLYMLLEIWWAASPGKRLMGLRIGTAAGEAAPAGALVVRYLVKNAHLILGALAVIPGAGMLSVLEPYAVLTVTAGSAVLLLGFDRALHDLVAGTAVYRQPDIRPRR